MRCSSRPSENIQKAAMPLLYGAQTQKLGLVEDKMTHRQHGAHPVKEHNEPTGIQRATGAQRDEPNGDEYSTPD